MAVRGDLKVSGQPQMGLPAQARHRWGLDQGGSVGWLDLGDAIVLIPSGVSVLRDELLERADWESARSGFGDLELAKQ